MKKKKVPHKRKKNKKAVKREFLRERRQPRKRVVHGEENKRREQSVDTFEKDN